MKPYTPMPQKVLLENPTSTPGVFSVVKMARKRAPVRKSAIVMLFQPRVVHG